MELITINFQGSAVDIQTNSIDEDEIDWQVFDVKTSYLDLLDEILHDKYDDEICALIVDVIKQQKSENEMERQLSDIDDERSFYQNYRK